MSIALRDLIERAISTAAQAALAVMTVDGFGLIDVKSWVAVGVAAGTAAAISVVKSLTAFKIGNPDSASVDPRV